MSENLKLRLIFLTFLSGGNKIHSYKLSFASNNLYFIQNSEVNHKYLKKFLNSGKIKL